MSHRFDGPVAKIERARTQFEALREDIQRFQESQPYEVVLDGDPQFGREQVVYFRLREHPPITLGVQIGEIVHNLRSALDHMVYQLILANGESPVDGVTGFPVSDSRWHWDGESNRRPGTRLINGVPDGARDLIQKLQPYYRGEMFGHPLEDLSLWLLNQVWNHDKHRMIQVALASTSLLEFEQPESGGAIQVESLKLAPIGVLEDGAELARWFPRFVQGRGQQGHVEMNAKLAIHVAFDQSGPMQGRAVVTVLDEIGKHVSQIQQLLRPFAEPAAVGDG